MKIRVKCSNDETWHYIYEEQEVLDTDITCTDHPSNIINNFVIVTPDILE